MPDDTFIADLSFQLPEIPAESIISRTLFTNQNLKVVLFGFAAGQELSEHTAARPALLQIVQGNTIVRLGTETFEASAGAWVHMPAHLPHSVFAQTPLRMLLTLLPPEDH